MHGGGNCSSSWDCSLHGSCEHLFEPEGDLVFGSSSASSTAKDRVGMCECSAHYTGSHCSVHVLLLELNFRIEEKQRKLFGGADADSEVKRQKHVDSISLRQKRQATQSMRRHTWTILAVAVTFVLTATNLNAAIAAGPMWAIWPVLHRHLNSLLLTVPNSITAEVETHGRLIS